MERWVHRPRPAFPAHARSPHSFKVRGKTLAGKCDKLALFLGSFVSPVAVLTLRKARVLSSSMPERGDQTNRIGYLRVTRRLRTRAKEPLVLPWSDDGSSNAKAGQGTRERTRTE